MGINDILAAIDNMKRVGARNIRDVYDDPRGALGKIASNVKEQLSTPEGAKEMVYNSMTPGVGGIIKSKGGNWLTGSVEKGLSGLKRDVAPFEQAHLDLVRRNRGQEAVDQMLADMAKHDAPQVSLNNWIEGPLTKYVKRDMATEGDPVRKLAEQGVTHARIDLPNFPISHVMNARKSAGFPSEGAAKSDAARMWENASDFNVVPSKVEELSIGNYPQDASWLSRANPQDMTYQPMKAGFAERLGLPHLTDELANALNPESGLPRHLLLNPEDMQQMGMERAVRHVHNINEWRAAQKAQKAEADAKRANNAATVLHKEYPDNNPKGLRWVELKAPKTESDLPYGAVGDPAAEGRIALQDALKYEGDTMGHCVGRYCEDVLGGDTRIFSLRDAKGEPHVTVETRPSHYETYGGEPLDVNDPYQLPSIVQIKGKSNRKPNDEYLPFVQDFVKSGKWSDVGDLHNIGLIKHSGKRAEALGPYSTEAELTAYLDQFPDSTQGYAEGGLVSGNWEQLTTDGVTGYILR